MFYSVTEVTN